MQYFYNIVWADEQPTSVTIFDPVSGDTFSATAGQPEFDAILSALRRNEPLQMLRDLMDKGRSIDLKFKRLSDRVSVKSGKIYLDGEEVHSALAETIVQYHDSGENDFQPLVNFMEKIETNPNEHSREHLFRWLRNRGFSILPDGDFIAYKGIQADDLSTTTGTAIVDGEVITGKIPNKPGSVVEMPRGNVTFDPLKGCAAGLHVATFDFAKTFGSKVVTVRVNPRDVVSVPTESGDRKMRVCRYTVLNQTTQPYDSIAVQLETEDAPDEFVEEYFEEEYDEDPPLVDEDAPTDISVDVAGVSESEPEVIEGFIFEKPLIEYRMPDFEGLSHQKLRSAAKGWNLSVGKNPTKSELVSALAAESRRLRKNRRPRKA